jgi:hypothetical protein
MPILLLPVLHAGSWLNLVIVAAVVCSLVRSWRLQVRRQHPEAVCSMVWGAEKHCLLGLYSGRQQEADLCSQVFILPWLVILHFQYRPRHKKYLVLLPDMVDREVYRRLRVRLKLEMNMS